MVSLQSVGQPAVSPQVNQEFEKQLGEKSNNKVAQETHIEVGGKVQSVKVTETSVQAEAIGKGKPSRFAPVRNFFSRIAEAVDKFFSEKSSKANGVNKTTSASQKSAADALAQNKAILKIFEGNSERLSAEGIGRVAGTSSKIASLYNSSSLKGLEGEDTNVLADVFKRNVRNNFPESDIVILNDMVEKFQNSSDSETPQLPSLKELPEMAQDMVKFAQLINAYSSENKMTAGNLGVVCAQNFFANEQLDPMALMNPASAQAMKDKVEVRNQFFATLVEQAEPQQSENVGTNKPATLAADADLGIGGGRSAKDNAVKTSLDAISFLVNRVAPSITPTMSGGVINTLQDAIADGSVSFSMIQQSALNKGDLSLIRELALSTVSNQNASYSGELGSIVDSLIHSRPNTGTLMAGIQGFIDQSAVQWHEKTADKPEDTVDANAHARFDRELMKSGFANMAESDLTQALSKLEGDVGQRLRGVMGLVAEKVPVSDAAQDKPVLISSAMRYANVVEGIITALKEKLSESTDTRLADGTMISDISELTAFEKAALLRVGITEEMML
jgi:hypothetical protein